MKINYDPKAGALHIRLIEKPVHETDELRKGVIIDFDEKGDPVGIELLRASRFFGGKREVSIELGLTEFAKT
ncbi:MAG: DUF2283 domain-containing protein [Candidatus Hodarchaeota archaeon]